MNRTRTRSSRRGRALARGAAAATVAAAAGHAWWLYRPTPTPAGTVDAPPAATGLDRIPLIGAVSRLHAIITDPIGLVTRLQRAYGDAFTLRVPVPGIYDFVYLTSPEHYRLVMSLPAEHAGIGEVLGKVPTVGYWFPRARPGDNQALQQLISTGKQLMAGLFTTERLAEIAESAPEIVAAHTRTWATNGTATTDLSQRLHPITYEVIGRSLCGEQMWTVMGQRLTSYYRAISDGIDIPRTSLATTPLAYLMPEYQATKKLHRMLYVEVPRLRRADSPLLTAIDQARIDDRPLPGPDKTWMVMYALWNAFNYPGSYTYWTMIDVLSEPGVYDTWAAHSDIDARRDYLGRCLRETVRLHPVSSLIRHLAQPLEVEHDGQQLHIPAGHAVGVLPALLNRDQRRVPGDPEVFDPDRYLRDPAPSPASWGRGAFGCPARRFSETVTASVLDALLERHHIQLPAQLPDRYERVHQVYPGSATPALVTTHW